MKTRGASGGGWGRGLLCGAREVCEAGRGEEEDGEGGDHFDAEDGVVDAFVGRSGEVFPAGGNEDAALTRGGETRNR